jgi:hypothetical protein
MVLGASTAWPGVVPSKDVEIGNLDELAAKYPRVAHGIREIAKSVRDVPSVSRQPTVGRACQNTAPKTF